MVVFNQNDVDELQKNLLQSLTKAGGGPLTIREFITCIKKDWELDLTRISKNLGYHSMPEFMKKFPVIICNFTNDGYYVTVNPSYETSISPSVKDVSVSTMCSNGHATSTDSNKPKPAAASTVDPAASDMKPSQVHSPISNNFIKSEPEEPAAARSLIKTEVLTPNSSSTSLKSNELNSATAHSQNDEDGRYRRFNGRDEFSEAENWWEDASIKKPFIDTHCHLDKLYIEEGIEIEEIENSDKFYAKIHSQFRGAVSVLCYPNYYLPDNQHEEVMRFFGRLSTSKYVLGHAVGCHPKAVDYYDHENVTGFIKFLKEKELLLAVGECGLDETSVFLYEEQKVVFSQQVKLAKELDLPIVIHSRGSTNNDLTLDVIKEGGLSRFHNIHRHCFTYSTEVAYKWMKEFNNVYFGLTARICSGGCPEDLTKFAREFPLDRIVLETDTPFFSLRPDNNSHPGIALAVAKRIASLRGMDVNDVLEQVMINTKRLYTLELDD
uniref:Uncharacterized protein n=1 Tax=Acrobeloides nanus TaxID=290746 RepID=A0A914CWU6_9BILA